MKERIIGIDIARALAVIGMIIVNFKVVLGENGLSWVKSFASAFDGKAAATFVVLAGIVILLGHYVDLFVMVMPATVGTSWYFGIPELSSVLFFLGLFIYVVFTALTKAPLLAKGNPFIKESKNFHY